VLEDIRNCRATPTDDTLVIFFQIDEFQDELEACTHLMRRICSYMASPASLQNPLKATNTFIVPIFTGTCIGELSIATQPAVLDLVLSGLNDVKDAHQLFLDYLQFRKYNGVESPPNRCHRHILTMLGYIPNMIIKYATEFYDTPCDLTNSDQFSLLWSSLSMSMSTVYHAAELDPFEKDHLLSMAIPSKTS